MMYRYFVALLSVLFLPVQTSLAQDFDKGLAAYEAGDFVAALHEWKPLAERGDAVAQRKLGYMYLFGDISPTDFVEGLRWTRLAADQGDAKAQNNLGHAYTKGMGVPKDDIEAVRWFKLAAEQGLVQSQASLGYRYERGKGVVEDDAEAARWYGLAAEQDQELGSVFAQRRIGMMYALGTGVSKNLSEATRWLRRAAESGDPRAQFELGLTYAGFYVGKIPESAEDRVVARMWLNLAETNGVNKRHAQTIKLIAAMSVDELGEAERRAEGCLSSGYADCQ
jgi:uncharacterized protein